MADKKTTDPRSTDAATVEDAPQGVGISPQQVDPQPKRSDADLKADMTNPEDADKGALKDPEHEADQTSYPVGEMAPPERPPVATGRPDVEIIQSLVTGAGAHMPPDPDLYDAMGRPRHRPGGDKDSDSK